MKRYWTSQAGARHGVVIMSVAAVGLSLLLGACGSTSTVTPSAPAETPTALSTASSTASILPTPSQTESATPTPTGLPNGMVYSDLDGMPASPDLAHRLPLAIMIDDNRIARPQSGFSSASIVYQAFADGGEDRYMLIFQEGTSSDIGPVRSARPYYVYWAAEYKAMYGHFGGDNKSLLQVIPALSNSIYNMDDLNGGSCPYHRITARVMPHNAYTNSAALIGCLARKGYPSTYQSLAVRPFEDDLPASQRPASGTITVPYRTVTVVYQYHADTNSYLRNVDGKPQIDPANKQQVVARNIIVLFQALSKDPVDGRPVVANVGSGKALVFKEGNAIKATWKKTSNTDLTRLYDSSGAEIPLVRGEIFIQSVPIGTAVTYK